MLSARPVSTGLDPVVPFWNRLGAITRYPAHMASMLTIILFALGNVMLLVPFGFVLTLLAMTAMYRYAFACLYATANGHLEPPEFSQFEDGGAVWKLIGLMFIMLITAFLGAHFFGPKTGRVMLVVFGLALPGATITLAMDGGLLAALNPLRWLSIVARIGWPYFAAAGLCLLVFTSQRYAAGFVEHALPRFFALIVVGIVSNYGLVVTFHLMGYLVYQYHEALGFEPDAPETRMPLAARDPDQDVLDEVAELLREGKPDEATERLRQQLRGRGGTLAVHVQYRKLLRLGHDDAGLLQHGHEYMAILLAQDKDWPALALLRECRSLDPTFTPADAHAVSRLARIALQTGDAPLTLQLLSGFHQRFAHHAEVVSNYLLVATVLHERMNQDEQAREILLSLKTRYPDDPLLPEVDERLALIERMLAASNTRTDTGNMALMPPAAGM